MKVLRKFMFAAIAALPIVLCSCPEDCTENEPKGYVVKIRNDYSDKVLVRMSINSVEKDTTYCCPSKAKHTIEIVEDFYDLHRIPYIELAYTSIKSGV